MNKFTKLSEFIGSCPLVGYDMYFNFINETNQDGNTSLITSGYGMTVKTYTDGMKVKKLQCEIRQVKPMSSYSNTNENVEQMEIVKEFLDWINEQGKNKNFPDFGSENNVLDIKTPDGVDYPMLAGAYEGTGLYAFPFEVIYTTYK